MFNGDDTYKVVMSMSGTFLITSLIIKCASSRSRVIVDTQIVYLNELSISPTAPCWL